jgi:phage terminase small subunit
MKCPESLSLKARRHWNRIVKDFFMTTDRAMILQVALENCDRAQEAGKQIRSEGLIVGGRRHPAIEIEKQANLIFLRSMRELGLNLDDPGDTGRPPLALGTPSTPASGSRNEQEVLDF